MRAFDKIYIDKESFIGCNSDICWNYQPSNESIEYTRADAFIEKACMNLKKLMYDNLMFQGRLHREAVINNFVEDFKNYMKGE